MPCDKSRLFAEAPNAYTLRKFVTLEPCVTQSSTEMDPLEVKRVKLEVLRREHGDLDHAIRALEDQPAADTFTIRRLKKQKLQLKDKIRFLEDEINPDIIA